MEVSLLVFSNAYTNSIIRAKLCTILFFLSINCFAQTTDTIYLKQVEIQKKSKGKTVNLKTQGASSSLTGEAIKSAICRIDSIPSGKLSSIKFYFNHSFLDLFKGESEVEYKDLELGLLLFNVNEDGTPGKPISEKEIRFTVKANQRGSLELDLNSLYLNTEKSMYFGFELFTIQTGKNLRIMIETSRENSKTFYIKSWKNENWNLLDFGDKNLALKMDLKITLQK